jgi:hypothetical protein
MNVFKSIGRALKKVSDVVPVNLLRPGPTLFADGTIPADPSYRRLPVLIWGDAFFSGDRPQVRRALAGADAHECMYTWVYLNEQVTLSEMVKVASAHEFDRPTSSAMLQERFQLLHGEVYDPQCQLSPDLLNIFVPVVAFIELAGESNSEYCELGSTFFASIEKIDLCSRLIGRPIDRPAILFSGIEYSPFLRRSSTFFHPTDPIQLVTSAADWQRSRKTVFHVSRFVASYAFRTTSEFVSELTRSDAFHFIDVFNMGANDFHSWDLGLPITFMSLPQLIDELCEAGYDLYITKVDPEYHAAGKQKAIVGRIFGIRSQVAADLRYFDHFESFGGFASFMAARRVFKGDGPMVLREIDSSLSDAEWEALAEYKKFFPVWGLPSVKSKEEVAKLVSEEGLGLDLHFDAGQAAAIVRHAIQQNAWNPGESECRSE